MAESLPTLDSIYRGDDATITITATYPADIPEQGISAGDPYSLAGKQMWFTAKHKTREDDASAEFQKTDENGITARDAPNDHICDVEVVPSDTADMTRGATLVCDLQVKGVKTWTVWKGNLPIYEDVTRSIT